MLNLTQRKKWHRTVEAMKPHLVQCHFLMVPSDGRAGAKLGLFNGIRKTWPRKKSIPTFGRASKPMPLQYGNMPHASMLE